MIVSITGLAKKVLLSGSPTKFVIAIAQIEQTSYRATTNIRESLGQSFSTYILVLMIVEICFISFKKAWWILYMYRVCPFMKDYWLKMNSWLLINCAFHILRLDDYVIKVQTQQFHSFVVILAFIPEFVQFCFNKEVFINWNQKGYNLCYLLGNWTCCYILSTVLRSHRSVSHNVLVLGWCILSFLFVYHQLSWYRYSRSSTHSSHRPLTMQ